MYLGRQQTPMNWPIKRKGNRYVVDAKSNRSLGLPILIAVRDVLKVANNKREVKKAIHDKNILVNGRAARDEGNALSIFDTLSVIPMKKHFILTFDKRGKFALEEIDEKDSKKKISKIIDKTILKNGKTQINLIDGRNFIYDKECSVNDSVIIDLAKKNVQKVMPIKEKSNALVVKGQHTGKKVKIKKLENEGKKVLLENIENKEELEAPTKFIIVTE